MATVTNVRLQVRLADSESVAAASQHIYLDITPGTMTHLTTDARGTIVDDRGRPVSMDDTRDYHIFASNGAASATPSSSSAVTAHINNRTLTIDPHIKITVTRDTGAAIGGLRCALGIGTQTTNVTTNRAGVVWSNDRSTGAVTLRSDTRLLKLSNTASSPQAVLSVNPSSPVRGSSATITITPPAAVVGFQVTQWQYDISHTNPGTTSAVTATVTRPANEDPSTFNQSWAGTLCVSGTAKASYVVGVTVRASGGASVNQTVIAVDPVEITLAVNVSPRTGTSWESGLTENAEQNFTRAINHFEDTGEHGWSVGNGTATPADVAAGPNRGCQYISTANVTFTSTPRINADVSNTSSAFAQAQGKAYLVSPPPVRVIPSNFYSVGARGAITITDVAGFSAWANLSAGQQASFSGQCISAADLLTGTRRHEHLEPNRSHKANCLKARRALDPIRFAEALVRLPGRQLAFSTLIQARIELIASRAPDSVGKTHRVVDEAQTRQNNAPAFLANQSIPNVNADASGTTIGPVWNINTNTELTN